jgi:heme-binding NEAT domain protein
MHKRGSLSLSINAIVILVLAIAMLGLGLGFTKGMFAKFSSKLDVPPPNIPATAEEPVVLPQEELEIKHGKDFAFSVNYYNDYDGGIVTPNFDCYSDLSSISADTSDQSVDGGTFKGFKFIIRDDQTPATLAGKTDICTITFTTAAGNEESKQITIKIT